jgi:hypothetical protein
MRISLMIPSVAIATVMSLLPAAMAQVSLQEQLHAQYKTVRLGTDSGGMSVVDPGTVLTIQKGGVLGVPWNSMAVCPAKFQDNSMKPAGGFCAGMVRANSHLFQVGDKVYPLKLEVSLDKARITFTVLACDSCNRTDPPMNMKSEVIFQFAKGYLEKAPVGEVEDTIGQVFAIGGDDQGGSGNDQSNGGNDQENNGGGNDGGNNAGNNAGGGQDQQQAEPQTIEKGMTTDQVQQALGKPEKVVNLGAKQIFVYKDLKVTFLGGKVVDVQ